MCIRDRHQTFCAMNIPPPPLFTHLTSDIKPVATKSRRQSPAESLFMRQETARLHSQGIIRPSVSPWRAQAFVTREDGTHKRRMVVDYSVLEMVEKISQYRYFATFDMKSAYHQIPIKEEDIKYTAFQVDGQLWEFTWLPFGVTSNQLSKRIPKNYRQGYRDGTAPRHICIR